MQSNWKMSTLSTVSVSLNNTNPNPLDLPVVTSVFNVTSKTSPKRWKYSLRSSKIQMARTSNSNS